MATTKDSCQTSPTDLKQQPQRVRPIPILKSHITVHKANPLTIRWDGKTAAHPKVDAKRRWWSGCKREDMGGDFSGQRHRFASGCKKKIHTPGDRVGDWTSRRSAGSTENFRVAGTRTPWHWSLAAPAAGPGSTWPRGAKGIVRRAKEERPGSSSSRPGKAARPRAFLPAGRARRRLWSRQSSRNVAPASKGVSHGQVPLAEGRHGTASTSETGEGTGEADAAATTVVQEARGRLGEARGGGRCRPLRPAPGARRAPAALGAHPGLWLGGGARAGATGAGTDSLCARAYPPGFAGHASAETPLRLCCRCSLLTIRLYPQSHPYPHLRARTHTGFHKNWKSGPGLHQSLLRLTTPPPLLGSYHPLKGARKKGTGPITEPLHKTERAPVIL